MEIYLEIEWNETWQPIQLKHADVDECSYLYLLSVNYVRSSPFSNFHAKKPLRSVSLYWYANSLWPEIEWQKREGKKIHLSDAVLWVICFFLKRGIQFWYVESDMAQNQEVKQKFNWQKNNEKSQYIWKQISVGDHAPGRKWNGIAAKGNLMQTLFSHWTQKDFLPSNINLL